LLVFIKLRWAFSDEILVLMNMAIINSPEEHTTAGCVVTTRRPTVEEQVEHACLFWRVPV
ncbi:hypothetical protein, partial [Aeromonas bestiarum]|uniref:hypothetical protein n=1 Tax=Aeromonas bestiarum TaxID=105751 RepID=UPI0032B16C0A